MHGIGKIWIFILQALDIAYNEDIDVDIFIEPPEPNVETDEDSADEDYGGLVDNLTFRQVRQVKRYFQQQKRNIMIPRPFAIAKNHTRDQNLACYGIGIRGKKLN
ncbi:hypothetical protein JTB14_030596 [Gonioctena quinquepunctata]|nr:hypothetical protein JTB14_030596 [Gonioctena quinquepunctata]